MKPTMMKHLYLQLHENSMALARLIGRDHHLDPAAIEDLGSETRDRVFRRARSDMKLAESLYRQAWIQNRYVRTTMARLALAMMRRRREDPARNQAFLVDFVMNPPSTTETYMDLAEAQSLVGKVRAELKKGEKAEQVLDLFVNGMPIPSVKRTPAWFQFGLVVLMSVTKRVLGMHLGDRAACDFFEAIHVLRATSLHRVQVVTLEQQREDLLLLAEHFRTHRGTEEYTKRIDYLPAETYDFWMELQERNADAVLESVARFYVPGACPVGRPLAASPLDEFNEHLFRLREALFDAS